MNILDVCHLDVASFGRWDDPGAPEGDVVLGARPERQGSTHTEESPACSKL
jgi:hypothetical protein